MRLLQKTSCHRIIVTRGALQPLYDALSVAAETEKFALTLNDIPSLGDIFPRLGCESPNHPFEPFPQYASRPHMDEVMMYLHSSRSTGFPKAIPISHAEMGYRLSYSAMTELQDYRPPIRFAGMALPSFHVFGMTVFMITIFYTVKTTAVYPPRCFSPGDHPIIPTLENVLTHTKKTEANSITVVPLFYEAWVQSPDNVKLLASLEHVFFGGGPLPLHVGDALVKSGVKISPIYGATEYGGPPILFPREKDYQDGGWSWVRFREDYPIRWISQNDGLYELQLLSTDSHRHPIENLPDVRGYATSDLFEQHPTKKDLWRCVARLDDVIVLASGEKTVPLPMEDHIALSPLLQEAVMFGTEQFQVGILVEPVKGKEIDINNFMQLTNFRKQIWPIIQEANRSAPSFSHIMKDMIIVTSSEHPMMRSPKGTIMRKLTLKLYEKEIKTLYDISSRKLATPPVLPPYIWAEEPLCRWLADIATDFLSERKPDWDIDLFQQGFDSLGAAALHNYIVQALESHPRSSVQQAASEFEQNIVYENPSIRQLARLLIDTTESVQNASPKSRVYRVEAIDKMIAKYKLTLNKSVIQTISSVHTSFRTTVLLTGSTGGLESNLLALLSRDERIDYVYALNRPSSDQSPTLTRQQAAFIDYGLDVELLSSSKLHFIEGVLSKDNLGLTAELYSELCNTVTTIIHNAWKLDFNMALSSFEPLIQGSHNLIQFALASPNPQSIQILFTSSIASVQSWNFKEDGPVPEALQSTDCAIGCGYGEAKYVADQLFVQSGLQVTIFRIGQISGAPPTYAWSTTDWMPLIVKTGLTLNMLPDTTISASWIPGDAVAQVIHNIMFAEKGHPLVVNVTHPKPISWNTNMQQFSKALSAQQNLGHSKLPIVPYQEWIATLEEFSQERSQSMAQSLPAYILLDFLKTQFTKISLKDGNQKAFITEHIVNLCPFLKELPSISEGDVTGWVSYWKKKGLLVST